ncbi:hypothetical protein [Kribbella shirazensis]|uniref:Uncharacterized protein n=1 Tax=Kribbella shirazensis TaxID=1105143 RepID=A0A7X5VHJ2_9ACTN|nr:hypothetical protein [Kribbella shirazensis]NIK61391.1 hypothetical protein [Kribbella shirazensis]
MRESEQWFGSHRIQVIHEVNAAARQAEPARRAFTRDEMQALFDHADDEVARKRALGRKGWLPARDDPQDRPRLRTHRTETAMLDAADSGRNPDGPEFGEYGVC